MQNRFLLLFAGVKQWLIAIVIVAFSSLCFAQATPGSREILLENDSVQVLRNVRTSTYLSN